jgi:hypothetical protein
MTIKKVVLVLPLVLGAFNAYTQSSVTGIWQAEVPQAGPALWTVELKLDGARLTGSVSQNSGSAVDIEEGKLEGTTVKFKVTVADPIDRTITFTGKIDGDQITFTRDVVVASGGATGGTGIFDARGVREFTVNRVPNDGPKQPRGAPFLQQLTLLGRDGKVLGTVGAPANYDQGPNTFNQLSVSPDGRQLAIVWKRHIHVLDLSTGVTRQITKGAALPFWGGPVWSPDGRQIAYGTVKENAGRIYASAADGTPGEKLLFEYPMATNPNPTDWSPDGCYSAFASGGVVYAAPASSYDFGKTVAPKAIEMVRAEYSGFGARFSPDGRFITYVSDESDRNEVYVRPFDSSSIGSSGGAAVALQISTEGVAASLLWHRSGKALYYVAADGNVVEVDVTTTPLLKMGARTRLFKLPDGVRRIAVSPDGQRFVALVPQAPERKEITVASEILSTYVGTYAVQGGTERVVTLEGNRLTVRIANQQHVLLPQSETNLFSKTSNEEFEFVNDDKRAVTHMMVYSGNLVGAKAIRK